MRPAYIRDADRYIFQNPLTNPPIRAMMNEVQSQGMTAAQRMERQFFIRFIELIEDVKSNKTHLPSQALSHKKSSWIKQTKTQRQDSSALAFV